MRRIVVRHVFVLCLLLFPRAVFGQASFDPSAKVAAVAAYLDEQAIAVGHVDLSRIDTAAMVQMIGRIGPPNDPDFSQGLSRVETLLKTALAALRGAGIRELYAVVSMADVPQAAPFLVAPLAPGADAQMAASVLRDVTRMPAAQPMGNAIVAGFAETIDRLKTLKPLPRPELAKAFQAAGDTAAQMIFSPTGDMRRVLIEMLPRLPHEFGGGSARALADGVQWAVLSIDPPPHLALKLIVQSKDAESASALRAMIVSGLVLASQHPSIARDWPQFKELVPLVTPQLRRDQLVLDLSDTSSRGQQTLELLAPPIQAVRLASARVQSMNNLKQIGLALHNYHDSHRSFPPQAIRSREGKPLLSWRVAILPFLAAGPLYKEFRLDEPWDSEHNKKLIERMPAVFASPSLGRQRQSQGLTSYLAPLSKAPPASFDPEPKATAPTADAAALAAAAQLALQPPQATARKGDVPAAAPDLPAAPQMIFDNPAGTAIAKIADGTVNTIMVLEANPTSAVIWTKPDDLVLDEHDLLKDLRGQPNNGFHALFCDGSVRFISNAVDRKTFLHLLQMNDGNPVGGF